MRLADEKLASGQDSINKNQFKYLAYGLDGRSHALYEDSTFEVEFIFLHRKAGRTGSDLDVLEQSLFRAISVFGVLGGIGARTRRGFGSVRIVGGTVGVDKRLEAPSTIEELEDFLDELMPQAQERRIAGELPPYTAFSQSSSFRLVPHQSLDDALRKVEHRLKTFRGEIRKREKDQLMGDGTLTARAAFGLPMVFREERQSIKVLKGDKLARRASPVFIHIAWLDGEAKPFVEIDSYLPSTYILQGYRIEANKETLDVDEDMIHKAAYDFLTYNAPESR